MSVQCPVFPQSDPILAYNSHVREITKMAKASMSSTRLQNSSQQNTNGYFGLFKQSLSISCPIKVTLKKVLSEGCSKN